jgi:hypothetical protein
MQASTKSNIKNRGSKKNPLTIAASATQEFKTFKGYCKQYNMIFFASTTEMTNINANWANIQRAMMIDKPVLTTYHDMVGYLTQKNITVPIAEKFPYQYFLGKFGKYQTMYMEFVSKYNHNIFCVKNFMKSLKVSSMDTLKLRLDQILISNNHEDSHPQDHEEWMTLARYIVHFIEDEMQRDPTMANPLLC